MTNRWWIALILLAGSIPWQAQERIPWGCQRETQQFTLYDVTRYQSGGYSQEKSGNRG